MGGGPLQPANSVREIKSAPDESMLAQMMTASVASSGSVLWLRWASATMPAAKLALSVFTQGPKERTNWHEFRSQGDGDTEWKLFRDEHGISKELWAHRTGDVTLLLSLISSHSGNVVPPVAPPPLPPPSFGGSNQKNQLQQALWNKLGLTEEVRAVRPANPAEAGLVLAGNIKEVDVTNVMQSINLCKMSGKLNVFQIQKQIELYFADGELLHARAAQTLHSGDLMEGDSAVLDLFTWEEGTFQFQPGWKVEDRSVKRKLHSLLLEGATIQDYRTSLQKKNITPSSLLVASPEFANISEADFDAVLKKGIPTQHDLQKQIFLKLKQPKRLSSLIDELRMPNITWIPIIFNLTNLGLIASS